MLELAIIRLTEISKKGDVFVKIAKKLIAVAVSTLMMFSIAGMNVFAASTTQDGLEVSLTTDKDAYSKDEKITATLSVKNTNESDVTDIAMENIIPDGYEIADGTKNNKQIDKLTPNEATELKVVYSAKSNGEDSQDSQISQESQKSEVSNVNPDGKTTNTGDTTVQLAVIIPIVVCSLVLVIWGIRKKKIKGFLSIAISISVIGSVIAVLPFNANAVEENPKTISISQAIKVDNKDFTVKADVTYAYVKEEVSQVSETSEVSEVTEVEKYYKENAKIIGIVDVTPEETLSEVEVTKLLNEKGFKNYPITSLYSLTGEYGGEQEIDINSNEKHPIYGTYYVSSTGELWYITVVGKEIYANPLSYNISANMSVQTTISSNDWIMGYDDEKDRFFKVKMKDTSLIVKVIDEINTKTLDKLTIEEVDKL